MSKKSLLKDNKELMKEYNYQKNININLDAISIGSNKKIWWICSKNHEWEATVYNRTHGTKCPYCQNSKILKGYNDLETINPYLAKEWNYKKNKELPTEVGAGTAKKYWWICSICGYEWESPIVVRNKLNVGCPECAKEMHTSFPEQAIYYYCQKYYKKYQVYNRYLIDNKFESDIFIKKINLAIEYDGAYFHNSNDSKQREEKKNKYFLSKKIKLIRIKEAAKKNQYSYKNDVICIPKNPDYNDINNTLNLLFERIESLFNIKVKGNFNTENDRFNIMNNYIIGIKKNSLQSKFPEIAKEWDYKKNKILPESVSIGSEKRVWWICSKCGNRWESTISNRTRNGGGCPKCGLEKQLESFNCNQILNKGSLKDINPELASEWNYKKNGELTPEKVIATSNKKVWWKCKKGHEWETSISKRNSGTNCPYCVGKKVMEGFNDLATTNPELLEEWDYKKNKINPTQVTRGSEKRIWWICPKCNNSYDSVLYIKVKNKGCPYCAGKKVMKGFNDLATTNPELLEEWDYEKNEIKPDEVTSKSSRKVWWICLKCGNKWSTRISHRTEGHGCSKCYHSSRKKL